LVYDDIPPGRASWDFMSKRSFAYGHNTTAQWYDGVKRSYGQIAYSMARGTAQTIVMGLVALLLFAIRNEKYAWAYDKMLRGLGKVLWFGPFKVRFYGVSAKKKYLV
jgi:succinoglycan biosynthesis protein ExoM